jgi:flagellar biosynthetic protein FliO
VRRARCVALLLAALLPALGARVETPAPALRLRGGAGATPAAPAPLFGPAARGLTALALVCGAAAALSWWTRRRRGGAQRADSRIRVLATRGLGPRHHLVLVEVGERRLLVGTSPQSVATLADLSELPGFAARLEREVPERDPELLASIGRFEGLDA